MSRCSPGCVASRERGAGGGGRRCHPAARRNSGLLCAVVDLTEEEVDDVIDELEDAQVLGLVVLGRGAILRASESKGPQKIAGGVSLR